MTDLSGMARSALFEAVCKHSLFKGMLVHTDFNSTLSRLATGEAYGDQLPPLVEDLAYVIDQTILGWLTLGAKPATEGYLGRPGLAFMSPSVYRGYLQHYGHLMFPLDDPSYGRIATLSETRIVVSESVPKDSLLFVENPHLVSVQVGIDLKIEPTDLTEYDKWHVVLKASIDHSAMPDVKFYFVGENPMEATYAKSL